MTIWKTIYNFCQFYLKFILYNLINSLSITDPKVCVDLVFWEELNKCFLYFFHKNVFFARLGILSTPSFL